MSCEFWPSFLFEVAGAVRWEEVLMRYNRYHHLNHYAIFGGGYRGGAVRIMEGLIAKYGDPGDGV